MKAVCAAGSMTLAGTITDAHVDDAGCDGNGRGMFILLKINGVHHIHISLDSLANEPLFYEIVRGKYAANEVASCVTPLRQQETPASYEPVQTDGKRVFWENGAMLTLDEIMTMLQTDAKITGAELDDGMYSRYGYGMEIGLYLSNGHCLWLAIDSLANEPLFSSIFENSANGDCENPETNGERIYWKNGASLTLQEMFAMFSETRCKR